jgi:hypothetical protein
MFKSSTRVEHNACLGPFTEFMQKPGQPFFEEKVK